MCACERKLIDRFVQCVTRFYCFFEMKAKVDLKASERAQAGKPVCENHQIPSVSSVDLSHITCASTKCEYN